MIPLLALLPHRTWYVNALFFEEAPHFHNNIPIKMILADTLDD
ncbi:hypothetical protein [Flavobacterium sp.]|nr:hypothetical protein [Flavobacterium sp.]MDI1317420.1 hypothetical protein [Flavobacterium sp.]